MTMGKLGEFDNKVKMYIMIGKILWNKHVTLEVKTLVVFKYLQQTRSI